MFKRFVLALWAVWLPLAAVAAEEGTLDGGVNPGYHPPPPWFKQSFLDIREDVDEAAAAGKRLLLYFYQDGCPYCAKLLEDNFGQKAIADKTRSLFDVVAINMWGDREVTDLDGTVLDEEQYAARMKVMFTPTLLFLDEQGNTVLRLNGYYHPHKFTLALDYGAGKAGQGMAFSAFLDAASPVAATGFLHDEPYFMAPPYNLSRTRIPGQRPLLVLFEQKECLACDELHSDVLQREATRELMEHFDVVQLDRLAKTPVVTPDGRRLNAGEWARDLGVQYSPSMLFFDENGREVFRAEAYLKSFHVQSVLEYIATGAYREQPSFQRFVQARAERLAEEGESVDLWQ